MCVLIPISNTLDGKKSKSHNVVRFPPPHAGYPDSNCYINTRSLQQEEYYGENEMKGIYGIFFAVNEETEGINS